MRLASKQRPATGSRPARCPSLRTVFDGVSRRFRSPVAVALFSSVMLFLLPAKAHAHRLPHRFVSGALCIHRYEGAWNDPNGPYWGGMQLDWQFMRTYGRRLLRLKGTADHWTPHEQLDVSYRAFHGVRALGLKPRGWSPWPNTRRLCGL